MFIAAVFTIAKIWKQPKCPSTHEQIKKKMWYIYTYTYMCIYICVYIYKMKYYSAIKKILPFAAMWMDLENIMFSKISQRKTNTVW